MGPDTEFSLLSSTILSHYDFDYIFLKNRKNLINKCNKKRIDTYFCITFASSDQVLTNNFWHVLTIHDAIVIEENTKQNSYIWLYLILFFT